MVAAARPSAGVSNADFALLMQEAVRVSADPSQVQPTTKVVCVEQRLQPPLSDLTELRGWFQLQDRSHSPSGSERVDRSIAAAMSSRTTVAPQTNMPRLSPRFTIVATARPAKCAVDHVPPLAGSSNIFHDLAVVLTFSRPTLARDYAFIEEDEDCPGLCGTRFVRVFKQQQHRWTQVAQIVTQVS